MVMISVAWSPFSGSWSNFEDLTVEDGVRNVRRRDGGGLTNRLGTLTLRDVTVWRNRGGLGSGIFNSGSLTLAGSSRIRGDWETWRGGVYSTGTLTMTGASSIFWHRVWLRAARSR